MTFAEAVITPTRTINAQSCGSFDRTSRIVGILKAADILQASLARGEVSSDALKTAMNTAFGVGDEWDGAWSFKDAYEALEIAQVCFVRKYGRVIIGKGPATALKMFSRLLAGLPTQTRRSEEMVARQQFSTPLPLAFLAALAAGISQDDIVLEPSAGTGLLAIFGEVFGGSLILNELSETRRGLLEGTFPGAQILGHNAEQLHDRMAESLVPSVVLMNPPFSAAANTSKNNTGVTLAHLKASLSRLCPGGRLVLISGENFKPADRWLGAFTQIQQTARLVFSAALPSNIYARHGTSFDTRLSVFDKAPADNPSLFSGVPDSGVTGEASNLLEFVQVLENNIPPRPERRERQKRPVRSGHPPSAFGGVVSVVSSSSGRKEAGSIDVNGIDVSEIKLVFDNLGGDTESTESSGSFVAWQPQSFRIEGAQPHVSTLCQSTAMASVKPPVPTYKPLLSERIVRGGLLSSAQLETVVYAGQAHSALLEGYFSIIEGGAGIQATQESDPGAVQYRRGFFLGDGTGAGKGRQIAGIFLDNWNRGRKRGVWVTGSSALFLDSRRDWSALGMDETQIVPLNRFKSGKKIQMQEGIIFATFATLRSEGRGGSRIEQLMAWLGEDFDGVIAFDEAHSMANAVASKSEFGVAKGSAQGLCGLRLQFELPDARIVYASATAGTDVSDLGYGERLGLWGGDSRAFATRESFINAMTQGGIAAMEVIARDLKSLGLYTSRVLSYDGVEVDPFVVHLNEQQIEIYNTFAEAFETIHQNLGSVLEMLMSGFDSGSGQKRGSALSVFESMKQRFFNAILSGLTGPKLIEEIEKDLERGHAPVLQLVSTAEALLERRLADIPASEWNDLNVNITPVDQIVSYMETSFPIEVLEEYEVDGSLHTRAARDEDGNPILSREAMAVRDRLIERIASLPAIPGILDQILHHFGDDMVAEVTGRSKRILLKGGRYYVSRRSASANVSETQSFLDDEKRILVFSDAGGTGRSYHSGLEFKNQRRRVHYLVEPGWKADRAVQGLGRTKRTNQANDPVFRPVSTNVKGQRRFISTIARRLDALGAISRGQREGGVGDFFSESDNLESPYAKQALGSFYRMLYQGKIDFISITRFEDITGLKLTGDDGLRDNLPPIQRFLNRILALRIEMQNQIFECFDKLHEGAIEKAKEAGSYQVGVEELTADSLVALSDEVIRTDPSTGAQTRLVEIERRDRRERGNVEQLLALTGAKAVINNKSRRAAVLVPHSGLMDEDGVLLKRYKLHRPGSLECIYGADLEKSNWTGDEGSTFQNYWASESAGLSDYITIRFFMVTGLLLPLWKYLSDDNPKVRRLTLDTGERLLGRVVTAGELGGLKSALGIDKDIPISGDDIWQHVRVGGGHAELVSGFALRRSLVGGDHRLEITSKSGWDQSVKDQLYGFGCKSEIIQYSVRIFIPSEMVLTLVLDAHKPLSLT